MLNATFLVIFKQYVYKVNVMGVKAVAQICLLLQYGGWRTLPKDPGQASLQ